jgi:glutamyl-tRNA synthetase
MSAVRVRFAPSPTGYLHVGGARTAIFNWLFARRHGGTFILRVEDTDLERSKGPLVQAILDGMDWLGLTPDEGPFYQAQLRDRHVAAAQLLLQHGHAYHCFCPAEELKRAREAATTSGTGYAYPGSCRNLTPQVSSERAEAGTPFAIRFKTPSDGEVAWDDLVHGRTVFAADVIEDFVILRSDGTPTYMISVVCDDIEMQISHVIRGDDHLSNTPKQILLYRALERPEPTFVHLPLILGADRKRLSKRHGAVSVLDYREAGFLADTMFNFLALLGWSPGDDRQKLTREELTQLFSFDGVGKAGACFDPVKLDWLNGQYISELPPLDLTRSISQRLKLAGAWRDSLEGTEHEWFQQLLGMFQPRSRNLADLVDALIPYVDPFDKFPYEEKAVKKHLKGESLKENLESWTTQLSQLDSWTPEALEDLLRSVADGRSISAGKLIHPTRLALTGKGTSPGIFEVLAVVGRERSLLRMKRLLRFIEDRPSG